jgi:Mrp family chromosome partitioning ATPase
LTQSPARRPVAKDIDLRIVSVSAALVLVRELIDASAETREASHAAEPGLRERQHIPSSNLAVAPAAAAATSAEPAAGHTAQASTTTPSAEPVAAPMPVAEPSPAWQAGLSGAVLAPASDPGAAASQRQLKIPSFLPPHPEDEGSDRRMAIKARTGQGAPDKSEANAPAGTQSAAGFLERFRRSLSAETGEAQGATKPPVLRTNDLRHYRNQRLAVSAAEAAKKSTRRTDTAPSKSDAEKVSPALKSIDAVLNHVLANGKGAAPGALLVAGGTSKVDATAEAIAIARALVAKHEQVVLVDLTRGVASVSGALGLPRVPGLSDLAAGHASFEDVVRIDPETSLQVIPAGNPKLVVNDDANERFSRLFDALTQAYDSVVLHADRDLVRQFTPALKFEFPLVVAVLPGAASTTGAKSDLTTFSALGCPVVVYEQNGKRRSRLFERVAAI